MINFVHAGQLDGIDQFRLRLGTMEIGYTWPTATLQKYLTGGILGVYGLDIEADAFKEFTDALCADWPSLAFDKDRTRLEITVALTDARKLLSKRNRFKRSIRP